ncbi:MAG: DNA translocase FtsK [Clostridia bacterium]|nr:DNA translocase FtsK [Clostridia bacterium]
MAAKKRRKTANSTKQSNNARRQFLSVIWFAVAIFFLCVVFIKGENLWLWLHNTILGVFGFIGYIIPFFIGIVAIIYGLDKFKASMKLRSIGIGVLLILISAAIDIFAYMPRGNDVVFSEQLTLNFTEKTGGFIGGLIGEGICLAFGETGAWITVLLLIFVVLMLVTGTTLISLFKAVSRPVKAVKEQVEEAYQEKEEKEGKQLKLIKGFDPDISVDDLPKKRKLKAEDLSRKQAKVVSTYYDEPMPEEVLAQPDGADDKEKLNKALAEAEAEKIDFKAETKEFTENLENGEKDENAYTFPPLSLLTPAENNKAAMGGTELTAEHLIDTLKSFGVEARIVNISRGPTVTRYELQPSAGVKISKITNLSDDIALNLATAGVRIEAPIPNKAAVGIEVPNKQSDVVGVRGIFEAPDFVSAKSKLTVALGRDIGGNAVVTDLAKMPHGLIAGATGSGKSVCINSIIMSILYKATPDEVKLLMIDPKVVELGVYNGIPHLLVPVVTDPRKAAGALGWAVTEMEKRYKMFADRGVRNIEGYNKFVEELGDEDIEKMPHIVIIIDELADLMMTSPKEVEDSINRIAAKARAAGMHLLVATQRPSVDVVTGVIKANIPTRIAFAVSSQVDSRTILDGAGAEKLLGRGDMLFRFAGAPKPNRIQGCFVSDGEVETVVDFIKKSKNADYDDNIMVEIERQAAVEKKQKTGLVEDGPEEDPMLSDAIRVVVENGMASTSLLQRKLKLGYARAARIVDEMEQRGVVGPYEGSKPRKVLITMDQLLEREAAGEE